MLFFGGFCCLTSLNQHVLKNKYALFSKSNYQTNLFWFSCTLNHCIWTADVFQWKHVSREHTDCREVSKHEHNRKWIKFLDLLQSYKSRSRKNWTNSWSLILAVSLIGNVLIVLLVYKTPTLLGLFQTSFYCRDKLARL